MRCAPVCWALVWIAIFQTNVSGVSRQKRSLSTIKKLLFTHVRGSSRRNCIDKSPNREHLKQYDIYVVPNRDQFVVERLPEVVRHVETKPANNNEESFILNALRQFLASDMFQQTSKALRETINTILTDALSPQGTYLNTVADISQEIQYVPRYEHKKDTTQKFETNNPKNSVIVSEMIHEIPLVRTIPPYIGIRSPIISMPRKYSYEQIKDKTVQTFTLDKNSDVVVTETKKPLPRPVYIDDRIKEVILGAPTFGRQINPNILNDQDVQAPIKSDALNEEVGQQDKAFDYIGKPIVVLGTSKMSSQDAYKQLREDLRGDI